MTVARTRAARKIARPAKSAGAAKKTARPAKSAGAAKKTARPAKRAAARSPAPTGNVVRVSVERGAAGPGLGAAVLRKRTERMLDALDLRGVEVSLALVGDETIRTLNREWRKKDKPTDVLSFPMMDDSGMATPQAQGPTLLGDVIVSTPTATRQARERKRPLADEVTLLLAHGVLHLLGFDHGTDDEEREMDAYARVLETAAVSRLPMRLKLVPVRPR